MGLGMKEKKAVTREYRPRYLKASKKEKQALLDEFTKLTGYHRKSAVRLLNVRPVKQVMVFSDGKPVKIKPERKRPSNRKGKRVYTDEVIGCLRLVWAFFWFKCGKILAPPDAPADALHRPVAGLRYHRGNSGKTHQDKPRVHRPLPQKRQGKSEAEREKRHQSA